VREDLVRVVEMGPFKHKVDQGLELRKLAYETLLRLLDPPALHRLDLDRFLVVAQQGLADPANELKVLTHLIIERAAAANAAVTRHHLDAFVPALETTLSMTAKSNAVKQEVERLDELLASTLRLALSLE
ncbi:TATA-binding protein interacting, partial [Caulochytrium protostelioides]